MTKATFEFAINPDENNPIYIYIADDGYPEGVADCFLEMHRFRNHKSGLAGRFFRANDLAEFISNHACITDAQFQYILNNTGILIAKEKLSNGVWKKFFEGQWYEFINQYLHEDLILFEKYEKYGYELGLVMTVDEAKIYIEDKRKYATYLREKSKLDNEDHTLRISETEEKARFIQLQLNPILIERTTPLADNESDNEDKAINLIETKNG